MNCFYRKSIPLVFLLLCSLTASLYRQPELNRGSSLQLAAFTDPANSIHVSIQLSHLLDGSFLLSATFVAPKGYHLYSKDIVQMGFINQGHPTRLDLLTSSKMHAAGALSASAPYERYGHDPYGPPVYPEGPVTLFLPVTLPAGANGWVDDRVSLTYMACSITTCGSPTIGKLVAISIPELAAVGGP